MSYTDQEVRAVITRFGEDRFDTLYDIAAEGETDGIYGVHLVAIGIRETNLRNIAGDGGHGRGVFQIDDRFHQDWLRKHWGCSSGSFKPTFTRKQGGAFPAGRVPGLSAGARKAVALLRANMVYGKSQGVKQADLLRFAIASYNCGAGNAIRAYRAGGISNVDRYTAHGNYSREVLRLVDQVRAVAHRLHWR